MMNQDRSQTTDEQIVHHMNELQRLVRSDVEWIESQERLNDYIIHVTVLESNLQQHAEKMLGFRKKIVASIAEKCGKDGKDIYGRELTNIKIRGFFSWIAEKFTWNHGEYQQGL